MKVYLSRRIYLVHHGQTTSDVEDRYGGDYDDHLTDLGKTQAVELGKTLVPLAIDMLYFSPRLRTAETAEILKKYLSCPQEAVADLRERNQYGALSGLTKAEALAKYPDQVALLTDYWTQLPNAESYPDFSARVLAAYENILKSDFKTIVILTHNGTMRCLLRELFGVELSRPIEPCEVIGFDKVGSIVRLLDPPT